MRKETGVWETWGAENPYFSVIATEEFDSKNVDTNAIDRFYQSGKGDITTIFQYLNENEITIDPNWKVMDFGSGLGRLSASLAKEFHEVVGVDISQNHINIARNNMKMMGYNNVEFFNLNEKPLESFKNSFDFIVTLLVLQHIPVDELALTLSTLMQNLKPNGIIAFQIPTYHPRYDFKTGSFQNEEGKDKFFLMNGMMQKDIYLMALENGLVPIATNDLNIVYGEWRCHIFFFQKK